MEIILLRHGKTAGNLLRRYIGRTDEPLCREGVEHARLTGCDTRVTRVYVSPMKRALETAHLKFPNAAQVLCAELREMDFGDFEGLSADELEHNADYIRWLESNCTLRCPNGEQLDAFTDRICRAFDTIVRDCVDAGDEQLVVVAHGGTLMSILSRYAKPARPYHEWYVGNCCGYRARIVDKEWAANPVLTGCEKYETLEVRDD